MDASEKRAAALQKLKESRLKKTKINSSDSSASAATSGPSKYFTNGASGTPPSSASQSVVLVPNSSPGVSPAKRGYEPHHKTTILPPMRSSFDRGGWGDDIRTTGASTWRNGDEPPAKKRNLGSNGWTSASGSPAGEDMPRINRAPIFAPTPRPAQGVVHARGPSSDVELVEDTPARNGSAAPLRSPIISALSTAGRAASSPLSSAPTTPQLAPGQDPRLLRLHTLHPERPMSELERILKESNGDMKVATDRLMAKPSPSRPPVRVTTTSTTVPKRRPVVQSPEALRGKQSAIYQNTQAQRPSITTPSLSRPPDSKPKRRLVDSDDEEEEQGNWSGGSNSEADDDADHLTRREADAVKWFNGAESKMIVEVTACTMDQADIIVSLRPFSSPGDVRKKLGKKKGITARVFEDYVDILDGYAKVGTLLTRCEAVGAELLETVGVWGDTSGSIVGSAVGSRAGSVAPEPVQAGPPPKAKEALLEQPTNMENLSLKDYQLYGLSWLYLLYRKGLSCILADEMGLGKTIQVIAFYALLKQKGIRGRHLIIVPSSTLENWLREFRRFAPVINVQSYYGSQTERQLRRAELRASDADWDVLITTYNLAQGAEADRKFFTKKLVLQTCVFDEGHVLKNYQSQRYQHLMQINVHWRLMLTGTPLQNNLQELVSLLNFLLPKYFAEAQESLRAIFKVKADASTSFLSRERVSRAKTMMTPFVLRRRKDQVLRDLPKKTERVEFCSLSSAQTEIYRDVLKRSRKALETLPDEDEPPKKKTRSSKPAQTKQPADTSTNVLMDLRKASLHPMLFRKRFTDTKLKVIAKDCLKEPEFAESNYDYVVEDMSVMSDAELQVFCEKFKSVHKHKLNDKAWLDSGKVDMLLKLIAEYRAQGRRLLVFSQFVQVLDILQHVLDKEGIRYLVLTGSTAVDVRQSLVDEFSDDANIPIFLLSTKAGGMGINLTAASVVVLFDQDFNPHNDRQAADRAYRIGQTRSVDVVKFITRGTIEEDIYRLGQTKLALDVAVAGGEEVTQEGEEGKIEKLMKATLIGALRKKLAADGDDGVIAGTMQLIDSDAEEAFLKAEEKTEPDGRKDQ